MSLGRFKTWKEAHDEAQSVANRTGVPVGIRRVRKYGEDGFNLSFIPRLPRPYPPYKHVDPQGTLP